jgi:hypothetical protein
MAIKDLFLKLTSTTTPHGHEALMEPYMPKGWKKDPAGNYYYVIGEKNGTTMFCCHIDTADSGQPKKITHVEDGKWIKTDGTTILGGDDKAGAAILIHMIENKVPGLYYFFLGEERGCIGSHALQKQLEAKKDGVYENINKVIAFDRRGYDSVITFQMGERNCSDEFADDLAKKLNDAGGFKYMKDQTGLVTDSHHFAGMIPECVNLSVGYDDQHFVREKQDFEFLDKLAKACTKVDWESITVARDPSKVERRSYNYSGGGNRGNRYHDWDDYNGDWWQGSTQSASSWTRPSSAVGPGQLPPNTEFVADYLGNKIKVADAQWCEYDKAWCLKSEAIWVEYIGFFTCPDFDPAKVKKEPVAVASSGNASKGDLAPIEEKDVKVGLQVYNKEGELYGSVTEFTDKIYIKTVQGSQFIIPMDKFLTYEFTKNVAPAVGNKKLTEKDVKEGILVDHPTFGPGKIIGVRPDKSIVRVSFKNKGDKDVRVDVAEMKF